MCIKIHKEGELPKEFTKTLLLPIPKKNTVKKCKEFRTISLISHTIKILLRILNRGLCSKMKEELEEEQFGLRKLKGTRNAIGLIRTIGERYIENIKMCMQYLLTSKKHLTEWIGRNPLKKIRVDWKERRLLSNLYMKQRIKVRIGEEMSEGRKIGRRVRQGCPLSPTLFNIYLEDIMKNCSPNTGV